MNKKVGIIKRVLAVGLIFLLSINSFAATMGDNDGSAFITKAEFDSLKNNFQSQIDSYNQGIDSKIDAAISAYINGLNINTKKNYKNVSGFDKYYFINKTLNPTFIVPNWKTILAHNGDSRYAANDNKSFCTDIKSEYTQPENSECKRPLFGLISGSEKTGVTDLYWRGVALAYSESYNCIQSRYFNLSNMGYNNGYTYRAAFDGMHAIVAIDGYHANLNTTDVFNPKMWSQNRAPSGGSWTQNFDPSGHYKNNYELVQTVVSLGTIGGKQTEYDHIGCYKGDTAFSLSNETFLNTFRSHSLNTLKDSDVRAATTDSIQGGYMGHYSGSNWWNITTGQITDYNEKTRSIGMLKDDVAAKNIKQFSKDFNYSANTLITVPNCALNNGLIIAYGEKDDKIEWNVDISKVTINNGSTDVVNSNEVDIYVSYVPFSDATTSTKYVKLGTTTDYVTTSSRKANLKWTANDDSLFYVKMVPHFSGTSYINNPWEIELNLDGAVGDYTITSDV